MFERLIFLASGGGFDSLLGNLQNAGFFSFILPFLLLFAIIFGLLTQMKIFKDAKGINAIIALAVSLMSLQFDMVSTFFSEIFPRMGIGITIVLILIIFIGMFYDVKSTALVWIMFLIGVIIFAIVLVQTGGALGWSSGQWWYKNWGMVVGGGILIGIVVAMIAAGGPPSDDKPETLWQKLLAGK